MQTNPTAKRILCYGDSNTRWRVPGSLGMKRHPIHERWTGILQTLLGKDYEIIEEGLWARTTMFDDPRPDFPERNGLHTLPIILESHLPLDLVILMLGTTDMKGIIWATSEDTIAGMRALIRTVKNHKVLEWSTSPKILIIVPAIVKEGTAVTSPLFDGATQKGKDLIAWYQQLADSEWVLYLNPTEEIKVDENEGIHLDVENHKTLAELVYEQILTI